jgi:4-amino-4-deoxy-L-arabinose transferase-like glycosyltransferase
MHPASPSGNAQRSIARRRLGLAAILLVALGLRGVWALAIDETDPRASFRADASFYDQAARGLAETGRYTAPDGRSTARFPPGYPALLSVVYRLFGHSLVNARLLNVLLGVLTCLFVYAVGALAYGPRVGMLAGAFVALWPSEVFYVGLTLSEPAFGLIFTACLAAFLVWDDAPEGAGLRWLAFGGLVGLASLVRGSAVLFPAVPVAVWLATLGLNRVCVARTALVAAGFALALAPWLARNQLVMGAPVLTTGAGYTLLAAHSPPAHASTARKLNAFVEETFAEEMAEGEAAADAAMRRYALRYALAHPGKELREIPRRLQRLYADDVASFGMARKRHVDPSGAGRILRQTTAAAAFLHWLANAWFAVMLVLALAGFVRAWSPASGPAFVVPLTFLYFNLLFVVLFYGEPRYHAAMVPSMAVLAALAVDGRVRPWRLRGLLARQEPEEAGRG